MFAAPCASLGSKRFFRCFDRAKNGAKAKMKRVGRERGGKKKLVVFFLDVPDRGAPKCEILKKAFFGMLGFVTFARSQVKPNGNACYAG